MEDIGDNSFFCLIDNHPVIFDYSDDGDGCNNQIFAEGKIFKFHYKKHYESIDYIYPFSPVSFYDWNQYQSMSERIKYTAAGKMILNNQRSYGNAIMRRELAKKILRSTYPMNELDFSITEQFQYWKKIEKCLVPVFICGQNTNILDRGQLQYMALGACTISPKLPKIFPFNKSLEPDKHYLMIQNNNTDLCKTIDWCKSHRSKCVSIGKRAKKFFIDTSLPQKITSWIFKVIHNEI